MYSFHSSLEEKNQLLHTLTTYGIETTVDRSRKKDRIREWIQASAIAEENEDSDAYEDSTEFYEDEDRENESEEAEPVPMRGRHFPERRPSDVGKKSRRREASRARRSSAKPVERKIPFAPQVAEERRTIARFASFPNGDPSLAVVGNGRDLCATLASATSDAPLADPAVSNLVANGQESPFPAPAGAIFPTKPSAVLQSSSAVPEAASSPGSSRVVPMSPQIPARRNRAHTAPFPDARVPEGRAESATALRTPKADPPRVARSARVAAPTTSDEPTSRAENSASPENASATFLVMQSFGAFQDLAANAASRTDEVTLTYGKDAYEHYGIAHGAVLPMRVNVVRQNSAGSGSRSASN